MKVFRLFSAMILLAQCAYSYIDPFLKGTSYSIQIEHDHPQFGNVSSSLNEDGKIDNVGDDLSYLASNSVSFYSLKGKKFNVAFQGDKFLLRKNSQDRNGSLQNFIVLKNDEKCWALRKIENSLTPFEYTSISCEDQPVEENIAVVEHLDHEFHVSALFALSDEQFAFKTLDAQNLFAYLDRTTLRFGISRANNSKAIWKDFINLQGPHDQCYQLRLKRLSDGDTTFTRMAIKCDFDEIGAPVTSRKMQLEYFDTNLGDTERTFPREGVEFSFLDINNAVISASFVLNKKKFALATDGKEKFVDSIRTMNPLTERCEEVSIGRQGDGFNFITKKIPCIYKGVEDFFHSPAIYGNHSSSIHSLGLARLLRFNGEGIAVGMFDSGFNQNDKAIRDKSIPGGKMRERDDGQGFELVEEPSLYKNKAAHGSNQAKVLLGTHMGKRVGIAPSALYMPLDANWGMSLREASFLKDNYGVGIFTNTQYLFNFSSLYRDGDGEIGDILYVVIAGNKEGAAQAETFLSYNMPTDEAALNKVIVTVAVDERGKLTKKSRSCGATKALCLAVPGNGPTSPTATTVAGVAALLKQAFPQATYGQIRRALLEGVTPLSLPHRTPSEQTGVGMLNAYKAYLRLDEILTESPL